MIKRNNMISEKKLYNYINGTLNEKDANLVNKELQENIETFKRYCELKELIYMQKTAPPVNTKLKNKLINLPKKINETFKIDIAISFFDNVLKAVCESGWERKNTFNLALETRSQEEEHDVVALTKVIKEYSVDVVVMRKNQTNFNLMLSVRKRKNEVKNITAHLFCEDMEVEFIDLSQKNSFDYELQSGRYSILFKKNDKTLFDISLSIGSETNGNE